jgi:hypothetical protein
LWEIATGQPMCTLKGIHPGPNVAAFSTDGKSLFYTCWRWSKLGSGRGAILRDISAFDDLEQVTGPEFSAVCLASGRFLRPLQGHPARITCVSFAPDGKTVVTASSDGTMLRWKVAAFLQSLAQPAKLQDVEREQLWEKLAHKDAAITWQALARLENDPVATLRFLQKQIRPVAAPDPAHVAQLITDLESDRFAVRSKALAELAESALNKAAMKITSLELRRRLNTCKHNCRMSTFSPRSCASYERLPCWKGSVQRNRADYYRYWPTVRRKLGSRKKPRER